MSAERELEELQEFHDQLSTEEAAGFDAGREPSVRGRRGRTRDDAPERSGRVAKNTQMWAVYGGKTFAPCEQAVKELPSGQFTVENSDQLGIFFRQTDVNLDDLITLPDSVSDEVVKEITKFWQYEARFRKFGFLWKRGALLWGPPGGGKTCTLQIISQNIVDTGGVSVYVTDPDLVARGLHLLRNVEPKRPIVVMIEDIDAVIEEYGETDVLALMDGELQIDNVVFIATTNYPERLDRRFINRPSRFDIIKKISMPTPQAREVYLKTKNKRLTKPENQKEVKMWVEQTNGFSIAHLKELIISVEVFEMPTNTAITRLRTMMQNPPKSSDNDGDTKFGFGKGS